MDRTANLLGATALRAVDLIAAATADAAGRGAHAPAALTTIDRLARPTVEELRRHLGLSQPATVRLVDRLVADDLVRREPGRDARSLGLTLTPRGRRTVAAVRAARERALEELLGGLDAAERVSLGTLLDALLERAGVGLPAGHQVCRLCDVGSCRASRGCPVDRSLEAPR